jgi:hypothetical protein
MSDNNGWPHKPGVPLNPERDGWHWFWCPLKRGVFPCFWRAAGEAHNCRWTAKWLYSRNDWNPKECTYLGPALTPAEVDARVKQARRDALEEAALRLEELHRQHKYNPKTGDGSEHDTGYYRALVEGAGWIRALNGEGDD